MKKKQNEVREPAELADTLEIEDEEQVIAEMLKWLMPWLDKTDDSRTLGNWEMTLPTAMMMKLMEQWLTVEGLQTVNDIMKWYHPLDRATLAYALLVYLTTGKRMTFKNKVAQRHYRILLQKLKDDMVELSFTGHMKYMLRRYGGRKVVKGVKGVKE